MQALSNRLWSSGFFSPSMPAWRCVGRDPVLYLKNPPGVDRDLRRAMLDGVNDLNRQLFDRVGDPEINARIAQYEMAFRMQASRARADRSVRRAGVHLGSVRREGQGAGHLCLQLPDGAAHGRARRALHADFPAQLGPSHAICRNDMRALAEDSDRPTYALITDLKRRGMLDDTLVIWGGEFGRTVY